MIGLLEWATSSLPALVTSLGTAATALGGSGVRWVQEGDRALVMRFGKAVKGKDGQYRVIEPGFAWIIPGVDKLHKTHVRQDVIDLKPQTLTLSDKTIFAVSAVLRYRVKPTPQDLYNALIETEDLEQALQDAGLTAVRDVLVPRGYEEMLEHRDVVNEQLTAAMALVASDWGVEVLSFKLSDTDPDVETAQLIQMQAATEAKLKAAELVASKLGCSLAQVPAVWIASVGSVRQAVTTTADSAKVA